MFSYGGLAAIGFISIGLLITACHTTKAERHAAASASQDREDLRDTLTARQHDNGTSFIVTGLSFERNSAKVDTRAKKKLIPLANYLREHPDYKIIVHGHTDNTGDYNFNIALSEKRAVAVKKALVTDLHIPADRIITLGHGPNEPIASNDTKEGRQKNRRIEVVFVRAPDTTASN